MDIDARVAPDIVGSLTDLDQLTDDSFDAVFCSHSLEHLHTHDVGKALRGIFRILQPTGFALITSPDLEPIAKLVSEGRGEEIAYQSSVGPITALDMIYGHAASIERGNTYMAHNTGFTADRVARLLLEAGFVEVLVTEGDCFDLWAVALMPDAEKDSILTSLDENGLDFFE